MESTQAFYCEYCEEQLFLKNSFFYRTLPLAVSAKWLHDVKHNKDQIHMGSLALDIHSV